MSRLLDRIFSEIDRKFRREDGSIMYETRFSRWIRIFTERHIVLGTLLVSTCMTFAMMLLLILMTQARFLANAVIIGVICMPLFIVWFGLSNRWRRQTYPRQV